ncbi:MAG: Hint domain-containing protein [Marinibacterium sp.]|nr:Hint domain-containing protein [Marinibacterium sp.]
MAVDTRGFNDTNATTNGVTSLNGTEAIIYDDLSAVRGQAGSVFFNDTISLEANFSISYSATFVGPDGIAFVMQASGAGASALGGVGIGMGYAGIANGLAVELDTYFNGPGFNNVDINDNSSVIRDTDASARDPSGNLTTQVDLDPIADLKDGLAHDVQIDWNAATNTITWSLDGIQLDTATFTEADLDTHFGTGVRDVYIGLTGAKFGEGSGVVEDFTVTADFACFARGTRIATPAGETLVEDLQIGDLVRAADGRDVPVKWVGTQTVMTRFKPAERLALVRFAAGSLGNDLPRRDLMVTTDHAMLVDGVLCHAGALVNGDSIVQIPAAEMGESYTVYHIETDTHEIILAEGAETETFIDNVSRRVFDNYAEFEALYGDVDEMIELPLPRALSQRQVPLALRKRLGAVRAA